MRILYAEDDDPMRAFLTRALVGAGHIVHDFGNGIDARAFWDDHKDELDLILTDIVMPGLDGFELTAHARTARPDIFVIYVTGFAAIGDGTPPHHGQVLQKPLHIRALLSQIEELACRKDR